MKIKKASMFSLALALALVIGVTAGFATSAASFGDDGREFSLDELDSMTVDVGYEGNGIKVIENDASRFEDLSALDYVEVDVGYEGNGIRVIDSDSRVEDLSTLDYVEGDVGTEAHGIKLIGSRELGDNGDTLISLAPGVELPVGTVAVGEGKKITVSITSAYSAEIEVCVTSLDDGTTYTETATIGTEGGSDIVVIQIAASGEYALSVKNSSSVNADFSVSYSLGD